MTKYEEHMRKTYPNKYKDMIFNEDLMKWEEPPKIKEEPIANLMKSRCNHK